MPTFKMQIVQKQSSTGYLKGIGQFEAGQQIK